MGGRRPLKAGAPRLLGYHGGAAGRAYRRARRPRGSSRWRLTQRRGTIPGTVAEPSLTAVPQPCRIPDVSR